MTYLLNFRKHPDKDGRDILGHIYKVREDLYTDRNTTTLVGQCFKHKKHSSLQRYAVTFELELDKERNVYWGRCTCPGKYCNYRVSHSKMRDSK